MIELFLARTTTIPLKKKEQIKKMMDNMMDIYRELLKTSPRIQKLHEEGLQEGIQKGRQEGRLQALQDMLVSAVRARYPDLAELAQQKAGHFDDTDALQLFILQVISASSARAVRKLLKSGPTS